MAIHSRVNLDVCDDALVSRHRFGRYCEDPSLPLEAARRQVAKAARQVLASADASCIEAVDAAGQTVGILLFRSSRWDSEHFGYPCVVIDSVLIGEQEYHARRAIAEALLSALLPWLRAHDTRFTSTRVPALDIAVVHAIQAGGFAFIEAWAFLHQPTAAAPDRAPCELRRARPEDEPAMLESAKSAYDTQRFHADPRIDPAKADSLYARWIATSFRDPAMTTLVHEHEGRPVAFMTYHQSDLSATVGRTFAMWKMTLIDPIMRGQNLGTRFFQSLVRYHLEEGLDVVDSGVSMRNGASINLHIKCGFRISSTLITFHRWSDPPA